MSYNSMELSILGIVKSIVTTKTGLIELTIQEMIRHSEQFGEIESEQFITHKITLYPVDAVNYFVGQDLHLTLHKVKIDSPESKHDPNLN